MWDSVAKTQENLATSLGAPREGPQSATSLQLSLESAKLKEARASYVAAIEQAGLKDGDVVGFVAAINGKPVSANVYPSNGLFRKVWAKQLAAVVTEAIGEKARALARHQAPPVGGVRGVPGGSGAAARPRRAPPTAGMSQETRDGEKALYNEARRPGGRWVHKNYLAK